MVEKNGGGCNDVCFPLTSLDNFELGFPDELYKNVRGWGGVKII